LWRITADPHRGQIHCIPAIVGMLMLIFPHFLNDCIAIDRIVTGLIGLGALRSLGGP
jgi:hypothetical protein